MLPCVRLLSSTATTNGFTSPPVSNGNISDETPASSFQPSPTVNLTREYALAVQTDSFSEIWTKIHKDGHSDETVEQVELPEEPAVLEQVLHPSHEDVLEALSHIRPTALTEIVSDYFEHSERTAHLCLSLNHIIHRARIIYAPLSDLLDILCVDLDTSVYSISQAQCDRAFDIFLQFDKLENPFPSPGNYNFNNMRRCFSQLREQLDRRLEKSRSRLQLFNRATCGSAICVVAVVVGAISATLIATHTISGLFAIPLCPVWLPSSMTKKEVARHAQLDAAAKGAYVLHNDLDTIDRLVARLRAAFESDKLLIRLGLERGRERHSIQEVLKQLCKTHSSFLQQLTDLDEHLCLCCSAINRARALLLREILLPS